MVIMAFQPVVAAVRAQQVAIAVLQIAVVLAVPGLRVLFFLTPRGMKFTMRVAVALVPEIGPRMPSNSDKVVLAAVVTVVAVQALLLAPMAWVAAAAVVARIIPQVQQVAAALL